MSTQVTTAHGADPTYAMYVWSDGFDPSVPGCDVNKYLAFSDKACFTHTWDTAQHRQWLWDTCNRKGRRVDELYLFGTDSALQTRDCSNIGVQYLKTTLKEGRAKVPGLRVFALFSDGGADVPEQHRVADVVWYNKQCATGGAAERLDGVAVNNEDYNRHWPEADMTKYLQNVYQIKVEAMKQSATLGLLEAHFSVGYMWGKNDDLSDKYVTWNGTKLPIMRHFINIFDSLDVQVARVQAAQPGGMKERILGAEWNYAQQHGKRMLATHYTDKTEPCQATFFPWPAGDPNCPSYADKYKTEPAMFGELDTLQRLVPGVKSCIQAFRRGYASGGHPDWPRP